MAAETMIGLPAVLGLMVGSLVGGICVGVLLTLVFFYLQVRRSEEGMDEATNYVSDPRFDDIEELGQVCGEEWARREKEKLFVREVEGWLP